jgi:menaquinone-specific isochorismate synthase
MTNVSPDAPVGLRARTTRIDAPADLLERLGPGGFAWLQGATGFVTAGVVTTVEPADAPGFLRSLPHDREPGVPDTAGPRAAGALPFSGPGRLVVPSVIVGRETDGRAWCTTIEDAQQPVLAVTTPAPTRFTVEAATTREQWHDQVRTALDHIERGRLDKVVLARAVRVEADRAFDRVAVLAHLRRTQPGCTVYADGGFVGASPELLLRKNGARVVSRPLAGTGTSAEQLLASRKDAFEHRVVVDAVRAALGKHCEQVSVDGPAPIDFTDMTHLATTITATCAEPASAVDLVLALHPTPAVAGTPTAVALDVIERAEPVARGRYAGPCGWVDAHGDGAFVVALRGGVLDEHTALLHAGAGIVAGSDPDAEWAETQQKFEPMLRVLLRP